MSRRFSYKSEVDKLSAQCFELRTRCRALECELRNAHALLALPNVRRFLLAFAVEGLDKMADEVHPR